MILYFRPKLSFKSAGMRVLLRHVQILTKHGFDAAMFAVQPEPDDPDFPAIPLRYCWEKFDPRDILVAPEGYVSAMGPNQFFFRRVFIICLSWHYIYLHLPDRTDWRNGNVERVLTNSPFISDFVAWAMRLPVHVFRPGIDPSLYYYAPQEKTRQVAYITRKQGPLEFLKRALYSRDPHFIDGIHWLGLDGLSQQDYAREIRRSCLFLNLSAIEGFCHAASEAMRAGALVAGFDGVGSQRELIGSGDRQNCILAENLDYATLARRLEPLLDDLLRGDLSRWEAMRQNALAASAEYSLEAEEASVVSMWRSILDSSR